MPSSFRVQLNLMSNRLLNQLPTKMVPSILPLTSSRIQSQNLSGIELLASFKVNPLLKWIKDRKNLKFAAKMMEYLRIYPVSAPSSKFRLSDLFTNSRARSLQRKGRQFAKRYFQIYCLKYNLKATNVNHQIKFTLI